MTVTPLRGPDHRTPSPTAPRGRRGAGRRRRAALAAAGTDPAALTITFEITLSGEARYGDALEILDTLRQITGRLENSTVEVGAATTTDDPEYDQQYDPAYDQQYDQQYDDVLAADLPALPHQGGSHQSGPHQSGSAIAGEGLIQVRTDSRSVVVDGEPIALTRVEFDLLAFLADHPRRVFGRTQLLKSVWGHEHTGERTVDVHVRRLRAKLGESLVTTVRSVGYRLADGARVRVQS